VTCRAGRHESTGSELKNKIRKPEKLLIEYRRYN